MKRPRRKFQATPMPADAGTTTTAPPAPESSVSPPPESTPADERARPGRRSVEERQQAVLELLAGKATVDQLARRMGVLTSTIEGWRADALEGVAQALRRGSGKSASELELERGGARPREGRHDAVGAEVPAGTGAGGGACRPPYRAREVQALRRETVAGDASVLLLCETFQLSRAAYYAELRRQAPGATTERDPAAPIPLPRRGRHTAAEVVLLRIREVLARETAAAWGVRKVWATLRQEGLRVSRRRVHALMRAHGLVLAKDREPGETPRGHVVVPDPNRRLATDLTTVWTRHDGVVALVPTIDCGDRTAVIEVTRDQHGPAVLASVERKLVEAFGRPQDVPEGVELRTDHGPQYTGADCAALCDRWGLDHTYAPVGRPTGNAVVERFIRTLKEELIWLRDWDSADQLRAAVATWLAHYNDRRPHQALDWQPPTAYRASRLAAPLAAAA